MTISKEQANEIIYLLYKDTSGEASRYLIKQLYNYINKEDELK